MRIDVVDRSKNAEEWGDGCDGDGDGVAFRYKSKVVPHVGDKIMVEAGEPTEVCYMVEDVKHYVNQVINGFAQSVVCVEVYPVTINPTSDEVGFVRRDGLA